MDIKKILDICNRMKSDGLLNYILPGLDSHLLNNGKIRLFTSSREADTKIVPHSHRFDFVCLVLKGNVKNTIYTKASESELNPAYLATAVFTTSVRGEFARGENSIHNYSIRSTTYGAGQVYSMTHKEIHSIEFSAGAVVLFFEGPEVQNWSTVLEPWVNGDVIPLLAKQPWMFENE